MTVNAHAVVRQLQALQFGEAAQRRQRGQAAALRELVVQS